MPETTPAPDALPETAALPEFEQAPNEDLPTSIFDLNYFSSKEDAQMVLDAMPFGDPPVLHLPSHGDVARIHGELFIKSIGRKLTQGDILLAYQFLARSAASSDIICGVALNNSHRCGGLMDIEISVLGRYYQCRRIEAHRFPL